MQANELRIGNYVFDNFFKDNIQFKSFFGLCNIESKPLQFHPIPLTDEWLVKFGFDRRKCGIGGQDNWAGMDFWTIKHHDYTITFRGDPELLILEGYFNTQCQHVHQLQNLYFAITGEELTIKQ